MSLYFARVNYTVLATSVVAAIVISMPILAADTVSTQKIAQIAKNTSVQINAEGDITPGGSGVIIAKQANTYTVLTANHVVCDALDRSGEITCAKDVTYSLRTNTGKDYAIKDIKVLQKTRNDPDLALVTFVATEDYPIATLGNSDEMVEGSDIFVGGFPAVFGKVGAARDFAFTTGIVVSRSQNAVNGYGLIYDARTITGNSGGPVFDIAGRIVAIHGLADTSAKNKTETGEFVTQKTGFNAGIPINTFLAISKPIIKNSPIKKDQSSTSESTATRLSDPQSARDFYARGITNLEQYNYQKSAEDFNQAIKLDPKYTEAYFKRGYTYTWFRKYQEALADFNQVIALDPNYLDGYLNRGWAYIWLQNYQAALDDFNRAIRLNPNYAITYAHQGMAYLKLGNYQAALESSKQAIRLDPHNSYGYSIQSDVFNALNDYQSAIKVSSIAIFIDPDNFIAYTNRAIARTLTNDYQGALADYQKSAEIFTRLYIKKPVAETEVKPKEKPTFNPSNNANLELIKNLKLTNVSCISGENIVTIMIDGQRYCVSPHPSLTQKSYQYDRSTGKLKPLI
jgi:tetratricopeptide (TPR) repeat protein